MSNVTIISDGTSQGTQVKICDKFMTGVTKVEILPISINGTVSAKITIDVVSLNVAIKDAEVVCTDVLTAHKIKEALLTTGKA